MSHTKFGPKTGPEATAPDNEGGATDGRRDARGETARGGDGEGLRARPAPGESCNHGRAYNWCECGWVNWEACEEVEEQWAHDRSALAMKPDLTPVERAVIRDWLREGQR